MSGKFHKRFNAIIKFTKNIVLLIFITVFIVIPDITWAQVPDVTFTDITEEAGIDFRYTFGDYTYGNILESSGSGVSVFDYDGDGDLDLYMLNGTYLDGISDPNGIVFKDTPNQLYRNNGDGTFTDVTKEAGVDDHHWSMAAGVLDYDNDGDVDIYLLNYGPNVFYLNNSDGTFTDVTDSLGLQGPELLNGFTKWSVGVAFWDYNLDGAIDMMVGNFLAFDPSYVSPTMPDMMPHPSEYHGQASMLYRQDNDGSFTDVTKDIGLYFPESKCMGLTVLDYDDDGDLDLFQGNDHQMNFLFRNEGNGTFQEVAQTSGVAVNDQGLTTGSMHGSIGDVDGDGLIDLLVTDLRHGSLYRNLGTGVFEDITEKSGVAGLFAGKGAWAAALFDFDNDGDLDIFSANGAAEELIEQYPLLAENDGKGHFRNVGPKKSAYFRQKRSGRGAAVWDFDNDGDLDIIVSHVDLRATATFLRNDGGNLNHWLGLTLIGKNGPASALGAKVSIETGKSKQVAINQYGTSYLSFNDPRMHFGLGKQERVDLLEIRWPDNHTEVFRNLDVDHYFTVVQGEGIR
ncbi:MAG TPA: CRTAC1 family protein [Candidatus Marinimicrobia bacterium]|nr:CRTAC1 family protein [Candidatus Neomarinimicrobiota bacterium]